MKKVLLFTGLFVFALTLFAQIDEAAKATIKENILGSMTVADYISAFIFAMMGLFLRHQFIVRKAVKNSLTSPDKFSWAYWVKNNLFKTLTSILVHFIIIFICLRFSVEYFGWTASMSIAFGFGLGFDILVDYIKKLQNNIKIPDKNV